MRHALRRRRRPSPPSDARCLGGAGLVEMASAGIVTATDPLTDAEGVARARRRVAAHRQGGIAPNEPAPLGDRPRAGHGRGHRGPDDRPTADIERRAMRSRAAATPCLSGHGGGGSTRPDEGLSRTTLFHDPHRSRTELTRPVNSRLTSRLPQTARRKTPVGSVLLVQRNGENFLVYSRGDFTRRDSARVSGTSARSSLVPQRRRPTDSRQWAFFELPIVLIRLNRLGLGICGTYETLPQNRRAGSSAHPPSAPTLPPSPAPPSTFPPSPAPPSTTGPASE